MIAQLTGQVALVGSDSVVLDVQGVGYEVQCTPGLLAELDVGAMATVATVQVVREDSLTLYGFRDLDERAIFQLLQTVSGVGPRMAQAVLTTLTPNQLRQAVLHEDLAEFSRVPGIGKKSAQRLVLELKDRVGVVAALPDAGEAVSQPGTAQPATWQPAVRQALAGLGWSGREAEQAVTQVEQDLAHVTELPELGELIRHALRALDRR